MEHLGNLFRNIVGYNHHDAHALRRFRVYLTQPDVRDFLRNEYFRLVKARMAQEIDDNQLNQIVNQVLDSACNDAPTLHEYCHDEIDVEDFLRYHLYTALDVVKKAERIILTHLFQRSPQHQPDVERFWEFMDNRIEPKTLYTLLVLMLQNPDGEELASRLLGIRYSKAVICLYSKCWYIVLSDDEYVRNFDIAYEASNADC